MEASLIDDAVVVHKPSLADPAVVDALVRQFAKRVFDTRAAFHMGEPGADKPLETIEADARRMGSIFLGCNPAYDATPWNTDNRLGMYFRVLLPEETLHYGDPGTALFMWLASQLTQGAKALEDDLGAEDHVKHKLDGILADVVSRLLHTKH